MSHVLLTQAANKDATCTVDGRENQGSREYRRVLRHWCLLGRNVQKQNAMQIANETTMTAAVAAEAMAMAMVPEQVPCTIKLPIRMRLEGGRSCESIAVNTYHKKSKERAHTTILARTDTRSKL